MRHISRHHIITTIASSPIPHPRPQSLQWLLFAFVKQLFVALAVGNNGCQPLYDNVGQPPFSPQLIIIPHLTISVRDQVVRWKCNQPSSSLIGSKESKWLLIGQLVNLKGHRIFSAQLLTPRAGLTSFGALCCIKWGGLR